MGRVYNCGDTGRRHVIRHWLDPKTLLAFATYAIHNSSWAEKRKAAYTSHPSRISFVGYISYRTLWEAVSKPHWPEQW